MTMASNRITLSLDGERISAELMSEKIAKFLNILRDVDRNFTADVENSARGNTSIRWTLGALGYGSPAEMTLIADPISRDVPPLVGFHIITAVIDGLHSIQEDEPLLDVPQYFGLPTLESVDDLIRLETDGIQKVVVKTPDQAIFLSERADSNLRRFVASTYEHYGSVEGIIETVSVAQKRPYLSIRDDISGRSIRASIPLEKVLDALKAFTRRISAEGTVRTNEQGDVLSIDVEDFWVFPREEDLPSIDDVAGKFDITMGKSIADHLDMLRDAS